jgi:hypothetical protein
MVGQQILALPVGVRIPAPQSECEQGHCRCGVPYFFDKSSMLSSTPNPKKTGYLPVVVGSAGVFIVVVLGTVICLLFVFRMPSAPNRRLTATIPALTAGPPIEAVSTSPPSPPDSEQILFSADEPIKGFSDCEKYGFRGRIRTSNETQLNGVEIVVWAENAGLLALESIDPSGNYAIEMSGEPDQRKLWVQVYANDAPASRPVLVEIQYDCHSGFQIYQIDWRWIEGG